MKKANITHKYKEQVLVWNCTYFVAVVDVLIKVGKRHVQPDVTTTQARTLNPPSFYTPSYCKNDINPPNRKNYVFINKRVKNVTVQEFSSSSLFWNMLVCLFGDV